MTNLEYYLHGKPIDYPEDVARLKADIPELHEILDIQIQDLYGTWSEDLYCASWLILDDYSVEAFAGWLRNDHP